MTTALALCQSAYKQANLDQDLSTLIAGASTEYPYNVALDLMNTVVRELNRLGRYWFMQTSTALTYAANTATYDLGTLGIDPRGIIRVRCELNNYERELTQMNWRVFQSRYLVGTFVDGQPTAYSKFNDTLYLSTEPDQDYTITVYHYKDIPLVTANSDELDIPDAHEDILIEGVYAYLCQRLGRPDFPAAYSAYIEKAKQLAGRTTKDSGIPLQMPAAF